MGNISSNVRIENSNVTTSPGMNANTGVLIDGQQYPRPRNPQSPPTPQQPLMWQPVERIEVPTFKQLENGNLSADGCPIIAGALKLLKNPDDDKSGEQVTCKITQDAEVTFPCEDQAADAFVCEVSLPKLELKCDSPEENSSPSCSPVNGDIERLEFSCNNDNDIGKLLGYLKTNPPKEFVGLKLGCNLPASTTSLSPSPLRYR